VLRGLSQYQPLPTAINLMWLISHPDDVKLSEYKQYDHVFVASDAFARQLLPRLGSKVSALLQCTDPALFHRQTDDQLTLADLLFVGNSRGQRREGVQFALEADQDFCVYGERWDGMLPATRVHGKHIPNELLHTYYSSAKVVLNDHWPDMRDEGFMSNRIFDAGACGAAILTDEMAACRALFGDALAYYDSMASLAEQTAALVADPEQRRARGDRLSELIRDKHTFDHRVADILAVVGQLREASVRP
jgi:spore maturation protein CgeB